MFNNISKFFTGNFLRDPANAAVIRRVVDGGHYVGPHSDRHILLADWDRARTTLVDADSMMADLYANYGELARFGVMLEESRHVLPPFEWKHDTTHPAYFATKLHKFRRFVKTITILILSLASIIPYQHALSHIRAQPENQEFRVNGCTVCLSCRLYSCSCGITG